jgi:hypothetical protein
VRVFSNNYKNNLSPRGCFIKEVNNVTNVEKTITYEEVNGPTEDGHNWGQFARVVKTEGNPSTDKIRETVYSSNPDYRHSPVAKGEDGSMPTLGV